MISTNTVIVVTNHLEERPRGGREMLCRLNHDILQELHPGRVKVVHLDASVNPPASFAGLRGLACGHINGVNDGSIAHVVKLARACAGRVTVFVDGSNLGALAAGVKQQIPAVQVVTFFHNVESRFFLGSVRGRKSLHAAGVLLANYIAERRAVLHSDKRVCLSSRDSDLLARIYGRAATHVSPIAVDDRLAAHKPVTAPADPPFALFVGGSFYGNREGIAWYAKEVAHLTDLRVCVVGRGLESLKHAIEVPGKVEVVGAVDDLLPWYEGALFVIAPILDGSGMKTKVAEALMYGKKVVGTPEAFSGYERALPAAGWVCGNGGEFAAGMRAARESVQPGSDPALRELYASTYSPAAARRRMIDILKEEATE